jgi:hypothetical protein
MTNDGDSVVAREQSFSGDGKIFRLSHIRIATVAPWGGIGM